MRATVGRSPKRCTAGAMGSGDANRTGSRRAKEGKWGIEAT
jgi:hypothetical protein